MIIGQETQTYFHVKISDKVYSDLLNLLYATPGTEHIIKEFLITEDNIDITPVSILNNMKNIREAKIKFEEEVVPQISISEFSESEDLSDSLDANNMYNEECSVYLGRSNKGLNPVIIKVTDSDGDTSIPLNHYNAIALVNEASKVIYSNQVINKKYYYNNNGDKIDDNRVCINLTKFPNGTLTLSKDEKAIILTDEEMKFIIDFISYHKNLN